MPEALRISVGVFQPSFLRSSVEVMLFYKCSNLFKFIHLFCLKTLLRYQCPQSFLLKTAKSSTKICSHYTLKMLLPDAVAADGLGDGFVFHVGFAKVKFV